MKMLMIIGPKSREAELRALIGRHQVHAYTELSQVAGEGTHGRKLGTETWPDTSTLLFTVVPDDKIAELTVAIRDWAKTLYPDEGARAFLIPAESVL